MRDFVIGLGVAVLVLGGINIYFLGQISGQQEQNKRTEEMESELSELREQVEEKETEPDTNTKEGLEEHQQEWLEEAELPDEYKLDNVPGPASFYVPEYDFDVDLPNNPNAGYIDMEQQETQRILRGIERELQEGNRLERQGEFDAFQNTWDY